MYTNVGAKLKTIAKVVFWVLVGAVEIIGVLMLARVIKYVWFSVDVAGTLFIMALAPAVIWLLTIPLYAFGHLIENSDIRTDLAVRTAAAQGLIRRESVLPGEDRAERRAPQAYAGAAPQPYVRPARPQYAAPMPPQQPYAAAPQARPQYPQQPYAAAPQARPMAQAPQAPQATQAAPVRPAAPAPQPVPQPESETRTEEAPQRVPYVTPPPAPWDKPREDDQESKE